MLYQLTLYVYSCCIYCISKTFQTSLYFEAFPFEHRSLTVLSYANSAGNIQYCVELN